ncbi:MAG: hypothetical protein QY303_03855 [Vicingaceae bacterium]|nr:MAG: hypothetical protein QY303_03855 [Vicingaceae bacterium]
MKTKTSVFFTSLLTITCLLLCVKMVVGQNSQINRTNHWYFGGQAGINFTSGTAVADTNGQLSAYAGISSISDTLGNLLMYTEGQNIWNKNHQIMPNGTGLFGLGTPVQSSIIIPKPLDDNIYYIFTCDGTESMPDEGVRYSIVDMSLNGGLGDVILKNQLLFKPSSEQLGATMHANCTDVWIMGRELYSNNYRVYLLTENGIDTNNVVINTIGNPSPWNGLGLKFSSNGKKMAAQNNWDNLNNPQNLDTLELFDFDNATGLLSNLIQLPDTTIVGFDFSLDNNLLYVSNFNTEMANLYLPCFAELLQYDISSNNTGLIKASRTIISCPLSFDYDYTDIQKGKDNKTYLSLQRNFIYLLNGFYSYLCIMTNLSYCTPTKHCVSVSTTGKYEKLLIGTVVIISIVCVVLVLTKL